MTDRGQDAMARPQEFETAEVLDRAMELFWLQGYEATSLQDLLDHMGIGRQSLYNTFGDKRQLFLAALDRYADTCCQDTMSRLQHPEAGVHAIHEHFEDLVSTCCKSGPRRACLIANTAMELAPHDDEIAKWVKGRLESIVGAFENAVANALASGEIDVENPRATAYYLMTTTLGLGVLAKGGASRKALRDAADIALSALT
jgi:TetR/AcrR family transcriptional repressor of nem operon